MCRTTSGPNARQATAKPLVVLLGVGVCGVVAAFLIWRGHSQPTVLPPPLDAGRPEPIRTGPSEDPRVTYPTPYRNVRPEVRYVGDAVCVRCHQDRADSYHHHPMGRSFAPASALASMSDPVLAGNASFEALGLHYTIEHRGQRLWHRETCRDPKGQIVAEKEAEVRFVLGSATRGCTFLIGDDGYLFESPIGWYAAKRKWDLSPGYHEQNFHFSRPITNQCLACHANPAEPVEHTENRYREPLFRVGYTVGCERCHGPGELHVRYREQNQNVPAARDETIVNPRRLEPTLREAVCQQCHLQGQMAILRPGRGAYDFRPGVPLHLFWLVHVWPPGMVPNAKAVGQVEQMVASKCYRASQGELGCISCHDPHVQPAPGERTEYFRQRCLNCHQTKAPCSLPDAERLKQDRDDNCAACHMPRQKTEIVHIAATDHRVLRRPELPGSPNPPAFSADQPMLVAFHKDLLDPQDPEATRALGVAMIYLATRTSLPESIKSRMINQSVPILERFPSDAEALEALGHGLFFQDRMAEALAAYAAATVLAPWREVALLNAGKIAEQLGRRQAAIDYWQRAIIANSRDWMPHYYLAKIRADASAWADALAECDRALQLEPFSVEVRMVQVRCLLGLGRKDRAQQVLEAILALRPARADEMRRWFEEQKR